MSPPRMVSLADFLFQGARIFMPLNWIDVTLLSFNVLLLLERVQLSWFPRCVPGPELAIALKGNPIVEWYLRHKCPELEEWLNKVVSTNTSNCDPSLDEIRRAEIAVMQSLNDLLVYAVDPAAYDAQPFHNWDSEELLSLSDYSGKTVIDVGAGTGRLTLTVALTILRTSPWAVMFSETNLKRSTGNYYALPNMRE